jgi:hypothetical protein
MRTSAKYYCKNRSVRVRRISSLESMRDSEKRLNARETSQCETLKCETVRQIGVNVRPNLLLIPCQLHAISPTLHS